MRILVTAGNTETPIDRVRCITNVFTGQTGWRIAATAAAQGHTVVLLSSQSALDAQSARPEGRILAEIHPFRTLEDLHRLMERQIVQQPFDAIVHCAAVGDFQVEGVYTPGEGTMFHPDRGTWSGLEGVAQMRNAAAGKIDSQHRELWIRLSPAPKLVDRIRQPWGFRGFLLKFKLEVGVDDQTLLEIAERSRRRSNADLMCANTLEGMHDWAYLGPFDGGYQRIDRASLPGRIVEAIREWRSPW